MRTISPKTMNRRLIEADGDHPDFMDSGHKRKLARGGHPLHGNPAYPQQGAGKFEQMLASSQYKQTVDQLNRYMTRVTGSDWKLQHPNQVHEVMGLGMAALSQIEDLEAENKPKLQEMAIELVFMLPEFKSYREPYQAGEFKIQAELRHPDISGLRFADDNYDDDDEQADDDEMQAVQDVSDIDLEVHKRHFINGLIQGSSISKNYAFQLVNQELSDIDPELCNLYGLVMAFGELSYFVVPEESQKMAQRAGMGAGGVVRIEWEGETPVIIAQAIAFPVLVQEIVKGLMELASLRGLPQDERTAKHVISKTDLVDHEMWSIIMGRGLWNQLVQQIDASEDDLTMYLYDRLVALPPVKFNQVMQTLQAGGPAAKRIIKQLVDEIRRDHDNDERNAQQ